MTGRILSKVVYQLIALVTAATSITSLTAEATAQSGFFTDPETGIVYRKIKVDCRPLAGLTLYL